MTDDVAEQPAPEQGAVEGPGARLAQRRQERGMSIEDVAKQLNLAPRQIQAIEDDNYAALPGMASVRGFIRSYAKLLKIDAAPLLEGVARESVVLQEPTTLPHTGGGAFAAGRLPRIGKPVFPMRALFGVGALLLLLAAGYALYQGGALNALSAALDSKWREFESTPARVRMPEAASAASVAQEPVIPPVLESSVPSAPATAPEATLPAPGPVAAAPAAGTTAPPPGNLLVLKMTQDSWVEVMRANRKPLLSRILKAGTTENIEIGEPVTLTIGNAAGAEVTWRGKPLDLQSVASNNVFRTTLK